MINAKQKHTMKFPYFLFFLQVLHLLLHFIFVLLQLGEALLQRVHVALVGGRHGTQLGLQLAHLTLFTKGNDRGF